nr:MAG TPA: hypothetical protein [Caudoviricetes sp.]
MQTIVYSEYRSDRRMHQHRSAYSCHQDYASFDAWMRILVFLPYLLYLQIKRKREDLMSSLKFRLSPHLHPLQNLVV